MREAWRRAFQFGLVGFPVAVGLSLAGEAMELVFYKNIRQVSEEPLR